MSVLSGVIRVSVTLSDFLLFYVMLCYACYVMLCYVTLRYVMLFSGRLHQVLRLLLT